MDAIVITYYY